jgi:hypothetical protein
VFDALQADVKRALDLAFDALTTPERLGLLQLCEKLRRQLPAIEHPLINQIGEQADATELGGKLPSALADRLLITRARPPAAFMLYAQDRGCTAPSCDVPAYFTEIHHVRPWAKTHITDVNDLTLACRPSTPSPARLDHSQKPARRHPKNSSAMTTTTRRR